MEGKFISYLRVSTDKQGKSGLGLEAQRQAVADYLNGGDWKLLEEFIEVESGKRNDRPQLAKALAACRIHGAILVVAKLDRLARNAHFLLGLQSAGVDFVACDMPSANRLVIGILAMVAEEEARAISNRTRLALQAAKRRGVKLGRNNLTDSARRKGAKAGAKARTEKAARRASDLQPLVQELRAAGVTSATGITKELNARNIPTAWKRGEWTVTQVSRLLARLAA